MSGIELMERIVKSVTSRSRTQRIYMSQTAYTVSFVLFRINVLIGPGSLIIQSIVSFIVSHCLSSASSELEISVLLSLKSRWVISMICPLRVASRSPFGSSSLVFSNSVCSLGYKLKWKGVKCFYFTLRLQELIIPSTKPPYIDWSEKTTQSSYIFSFFYGS